MSTTLRDDTTHAALVGGYKLTVGEVTLDQLDKLVAAADKLNEENGWGLTLFVPGDTVYLDEFYGSVVLGRPLLMTAAWDSGPNTFDPTTFANRFSKLEQLTAGDKEMFKSIDGCKVTSVGDAQVHLLSWGPLCYGAVHVGVPMKADDKDSAVHKYAANQDMDQEWSPEGLDGKHLDSCEFSDVGTFDHSPAKIAEHLATVSDLTNPTFFLLCRYD